MGYPGNVPVPKHFIYTDLAENYLNMSHGRGGSGRGSGSGRGGRGDDPEELGAEAAKFNGLFSEKDWKCKLCSNINWARRSTCNQCQSPKPGSGGDAHREGHGGGFNERDAQVEYRETRFQEDDEYDDFGRRKKKSKPETPRPEPLRQPTPPPATHNDDNDDDDDDDDDGKYDAWADVLGDDVKDDDTKKQVELPAAPLGPDLDRRRPGGMSREHPSGDHQRTDSSDRSSHRRNDKEHPTRRRSRSPLRRDSGERRYSSSYAGGGRDRERDGRRDRSRDREYRQRSRSPVGDRSRLG
ncbi:Zinc finger Ran-binding domain-containing protein 2 [Thoreauomyces humboldtii]|nr:Zinc finger Ran-binding domain-containing protein 2 [Thoreauomyces humboldtii]